jgi:hypothetical protein
MPVPLSVQSRTVQKRLSRLLKSEQIELRHAFFTERISPPEDGGRSKAPHELLRCRDLHVADNVGVAALLIARVYGGGRVAVDRSVYYVGIAIQRSRVEQ